MKIPGKIQLIHLLIDINGKFEPGVMEMKSFFTLPRAPEVELNHQMQFSVIVRAPFGDLTLNTVGLF